MTEVTLPPLAATLLAALDLAIVVGLFVTTLLRRGRATGGRSSDSAGPVTTATPDRSRPESPLELDVRRHERLLADRQARVGADHPDVASVCQILGQLYLSGSEYGKAESMLDHALRIAERRCEVDPLSVASVQEDLAILDERLLRHESAETRWRTALELRARRLGSGHPDLLWTATRLGTHLSKLRNFSGAESAFRVVTGALEATAPRSYEAVHALSGLAAALAEQDKQSEADEAVGRATALMDAVLATGATAELSSPFELAAAFAIPGASAAQEPAQPVTLARPPRDQRATLNAFVAGARVALVSAARPALLSGARVVLVRKSLVASGRALRKALAARAVDHDGTDPGVRSDSAQRRLSPAQRRAFFALAGGLAVMTAFAPVVAAQLLIAAVTALYLASLGFRVHAFWHGLRSPGSIEISDEMARSIADEDLPVYTILVPAYREPEVIGRLIASLVAIEYPPDRLDVKLLLEADDSATLEAAHAAGAPRHIKIVRVPVSQPRTKPKALNYGLQTARGQLITIYDAEDRPEPLQLRRAVVAFGALPKRVACLQAKLSYHNAGQNLLTRWFTAEYATWFSHLLPGLAERRMPLPLGGTSNHFRRAALESVGAWDAYNVTEDADLGIRLYRAGFMVDVLESTTLEEANSDFINWTKQRSRWYKGYLQTWLVHMRDPWRLWRELGPSGFLAFNLFIGGTPLLTLVSPLFWTLTTVWFVSHWTLIPALFPGWIYHLSLLSLVVGNLAFIYMGLVSARATGRPELVPSMILAPLYWTMMSLAAIKALIQLVAAPSFWEKTTHGLDRLVGAEDAAA